MFLLDNTAFIEKIKHFESLPLPKMQKHFVKQFDGDIVKVSKFQNLNTIISPSFSQVGNISLYDKQASEKMTNAFRLAEVVKEFILLYNPQKRSYFTKEFNKRDSNRATVDLGNGLLLNFKGFNLSN